MEDCRERTPQWGQLRCITFSCILLMNLALKYLISNYLHTEIFNKSLVLFGLVDKVFLNSCKQNDCDSFFMLPE